ncbi:MAG: GAF domain-containing protein, partial [Desulfobacterales bacterium]|nr:GAF domain-containing protein [Desulfobacterales bacterium]
AKREKMSGTLSVIWLGVPLMVGDTVLGAMAVQHYSDPGYFTDKDMELLTAVSDQVALALDRKKALEDIRKKENLTRALYKISNAVNTTGHLDALYQAIYDTLNQLKPLPNFIISIVDNEKKTMAFPLFIDEYDKVVPGEIPYTDSSPSLTLEVMKSKKTLFLNRSQLEKRHQRQKPLGHSAVVWLGIPLLVREKVIGVMVVQHYSDPSYFIPEDIDFFTSVSDQIALAIDRKQSQDIILRHKENLEKKVLERTRELQESCAAFETSEKRFREMAELMPQPLFEVDLEGRFTYTNRHSLELSGYSMDEFQRGVDVFDLVEPELREPTRKAMARALTANKVVQTEFMLRKKDGSCIPVVLYSNVMLEQSRPVGFRGVMLDLTERKKTEELMIQTEKMMSIGGLAAGMAHEINNPLAGMIQSGQVIRNRLTQPMPASETVLTELGISMEVIAAFVEKRGLLSHLDNISQAGSRAAKIIENMLGFARKTDFAKQNYPMDEILETSLELALNDYDLKKKYDFKHIEITRKYTPDLPPVYCERSKIQQVIFNILKNASQAMSRMDNMPDQFKLFMGLSRDNGMLKIEIQDNGPGMDPETRKKVFEPFFTTKDQGEGTGLGLSVSYFIIVDDHNGEMEVISHPGKGTAFIIRLPLVSRS